MLPALVGQLVVILKDSALGTAVLYPELLQAASDIGTAYSNTIPAYVLVAVIFILLNYGLTVARRPGRAPPQPPRPRSAQGGPATGVTGAGTVDTPPTASAAPASARATRRAADADRDASRSGIRRRAPTPLVSGPFVVRAPPIGLEPITCRLTAGCSAN